jgi:hypothetical protein
VSWDVQVADQRRPEPELLAPEQGGQRPRGVSGRDVGQLSERVCLGLGELGGHGLDPMVQTARRECWPEERPPGRRRTRSAGRSRRRRRAPRAASGRWRAPPIPSPPVERAAAGRLSTGGPAARGGTGPVCSRSHSRACDTTPWSSTRTQRRWRDAQLAGLGAAVQVHPPPPADRRDRPLGDEEHQPSAVRVRRTRPGRRPGHVGGEGLDHPLGTPARHASARRRAGRSRRAPEFRGAGGGQRGRAFRRAVASWRRPNGLTEDRAAIAAEAKKRGGSGARSVTDERRRESGARASEGRSTHSVSAIRPAASNVEDEHRAPVAEDGDPRADP